jgi:hypothetical protein
MKTQEELQNLKEDWLKDPCWDIENSEGFEDHKNELLAFREQAQADWEERAQQKLAARVEKIEKETGIRDPLNAMYLSTFIDIEQRLSRMANDTGEAFAVADIAIEQVRATLLMTAQIKRVADVLEEITKGGSLNVDAVTSGKYEY